MPIALASVTLEEGTQGKRICQLVADFDGKVMYYPFWEKNGRTAPAPVSPAELERVRQEALRKIVEGRSSK